MLEVMFKSHFPAILKVQNMFTPVFGPDKHTGEVRFCVKTMHKKVYFSEIYIFCQNNWKSGRKIIHHEPFHVG